MKKLIGILALVSLPAFSQVTGEVSVTIADYFSDGRAEYQAYIQEGQAKYKLNISDVKNIQKLNRYTIRTIENPKNGIVNTKLKNIKYVDIPWTPLEVSGTQNTLVISVYFSDLTHGTSNATLQTRLFGTTGSVDDLYNQSSKGLVRFTGSVAGPYTINYSGYAACDYLGWANAANAAAEQAGYNLNSYSRITYAIPRASSCGWSGLAYLSGKQSWVNYHSVGVFAHELGHNLSMHHASTTTAEYGDASDPMGGAASVMFNSPHNVLQQWANNSTVTLLGSSTYVLNPVDSLFSTYPTHLVYHLSTGDKYYVSFRTPTNISSNLSSGWSNIVQLHKASNLTSKTYILANLSVGGVFEDVGEGFKVTVDYISPNQFAGVTINGYAPPPPPPPTDTIPPTIVWTQPTSGEVVIQGRGKDRKIILAVDANDNVGVTKVEFFVDNSLVSTLTSEPWVTSWNPNKRTSAGTHILKAIAYDAANNSAQASVSVTLER